MPHPGAGVHEVLVVAGDEEDALLADEVGERGDLLAQLRDVAVHEVADDRHDVGPLLVDQLDQPLEPPAAVRRGQVSVGEADDPQPVERGVEAGEGHRDAPHDRGGVGEVGARAGRPSATTPAVAASPRARNTRRGG